MKVLGIVIIIFLLMLDSIFAVFSMRRNLQRRRDLSYKSKILSEDSICDPTKEMEILSHRSKRDLVPSLVRQNRGFTGRGSPLLSRGRYISLKTIDKRIERIVKHEHA